MRGIRTLLFTVVALATGTAAIADEVDLSPYASASRSLSAIASALSVLEPCDEGPFYSERSGDGGAELVVTCINEGQEAAVVITFDEDLWPQEFSYLP